MLLGNGGPLPLHNAAHQLRALLSFGDICPPGDGGDLGNKKRTLSGVPWRDEHPKNRRSGDTSPRLGAARLPEVPAAGNY
jgi:hypothetical protein